MAALRGALGTLGVRLPPVSQDSGHAALVVGAMLHLCLVGITRRSSRRLQAEAALVVADLSGTRRVKRLAPYPHTLAPGAGRLHRCAAIEGSAQDRKAWRSGTKACVPAATARWATRVHISPTPPEAPRLVLSPPLPFLLFHFFCACRRCCCLCGVSSHSERSARMGRPMLHRFGRRSRPDPGLLPGWLVRKQRSY